MVGEYDKSVPQSAGIVQSVKLTLNATVLGSFKSPRNTLSAPFANPPPAPIVP
jgi:hypothetical protein